MFLSDVNMASLTLSSFNTGSEEIVVVADEVRLLLEENSAILLKTDFKKYIDKALAFATLGLYDKVFGKFTNDNIGLIKLPFEYGNKEYIFWGWRGDYLNIGAGAELGIYSRPKFMHQDSNDLDHYFVYLEDSMDMELHLYNYKSPNKISVNYSWKPTTLQWWVCGWNPEYAWDVDVHKLAVVSKVDMSEFKELYKAFYNNLHTNQLQINDLKYLEFDEDTNVFWLVWADKSWYNNE